MASASKLSGIDAALLATADEELAVARQNAEEKERAVLRLYARLLIEEMMQENSALGLAGDLTDRVTQAFECGNVFNYVWHAVGRGTLFEQWKDRLAAPASRTIFVEEFNDVLNEQGASVRIKLTHDHISGITHI